MFAIPQSTQDGVRRGTRERLLDVMAKRPDKLFLQTQALVNRIVFDESSNPSNASEASKLQSGMRAIGVEFIAKGHLYEADPLKKAISAVETKALKHLVRARREVIVAGGAFNSPQLLMLSGIGPRAHLQEHGIVSKLDLPGVGKNLQDRYELSVVTEFEKPLDIIKNCTFGKPGDPCLAEYRGNSINRTYASNGIITGIKKRYSKGSNHPELFVFGSPSRFEGFVPGFAEKGVASPHYFTWAILKGYTQNNIGTVKLSSADPTASPDINFRYFNDGNDSTASDHDLDAVIEGIELARATNARARKIGWLDQNRDREIFPGSNVKTKEQLKAFIKKGAWGHHASCSNKMGSPSDVMAVVNAQCLVHGTRNLRVVDASVFPKIPGLFIVVPVYMLAEKISDDILRAAQRV